MSLYATLGDTFDNINGTTQTMWDTSFATVSNQPVYMVRAFRNDTRAAPWTMADMSYWNAEYFNSFIQDDLSIGRAILASEGWSGTGVTVGADSALRYMPTLRVDLTNGVLKTVASNTITDNFNSVTGTYYIEVALPGFPAQAAGTKLDLANSYIDFSSDPTFATQTDSFRFDQSLNSLTAGGNTYFRIAVSSLVNANPSNIRGIRFRLLATGGNFTFKAAAMRLIKDDYAFPTRETDTKFGVRMRAIPRTGTPDAAEAASIRLFPTTRPKNITLYTRFNAGTNPVGNDNLLEVYTRFVDTNNYVKFKLAARSTQSRLTIEEVVGGVVVTTFSTPINTNILTANSNYFLKIDIDDTTANASIYNSHTGAQRGTLVYTTGSQTLSRVVKGFVGYNFQPYNYDFVMDYIQAQRAEFAIFQSAALKSVTPVRGAQLITHDSDVLDLIEGMSFLQYGDATLTPNSSISGRSATKVVRTGVAWVGGLQTATGAFFGSPNELRIKGSIYPVGTVRGSYRLALLDLYGSVAWLVENGGLVANQWNDFDIGLAEVMPSNYYLHVQQAGLYNDTFYVSGLEAVHSTLDWSISADNGNHWQRTLNAINSSRAGVKFQYPGTELMVKAEALSDQSWIQGYEVIPIYQYV